MTKGKANWFLRLLGNIEAEKTRIAAQTATRVYQLERDAERLHFLFDAQVEAWGRGEAKVRS